MARGDMASAGASPSGTMRDQEPTCAMTSRPTIQIVPRSDATIIPSPKNKNARD
jgi:hypothetical protein